MIYAIKKDDQILIHTIAEWRRAAIVAYLLEDAKRPVYCNDTDENVETLWRGFANGAVVVRVTVEEDKSEPLLEFTKVQAATSPDSTHETWEVPAWMTTEKPQ